jgi:hypothetical protein
MEDTMADDDRIAELERKLEQWREIDANRANKNWYLNNSTTWTGFALAFISIAIAANNWVYAIFAAISLIMDAYNFIRSKRIKIAS